MGICSNLINEANGLTERLSDIKTTKHPPQGLFASGSASEIADWVIDNHDSAQSAMGSIDLYINRAGSNLKGERKTVLDNAKEKIHKHFEK